MDVPTDPERSELVFLCSGNVLRSAFCELYARHLELPFRVRSAATEYRNRALFPESRDALLARGVAPRRIEAFRPTHVADLAPPPAPGARVLGMTRAHLDAFRRLHGDACETGLVLELLGRGGEVADPLHTGRYAETFDLLAACVEALAAGR